jgi:hypothetical protein
VTTWNLWHKVAHFRRVTWHRMETTGRPGSCMRQELAMMPSSKNDVVDMFRNRTQVGFRGAIDPVPCR